MSDPKYDIYIEEEQICLQTNTQTTNHTIHIEELNKDIIVKIPNTIDPNEKIKLTGAGKKINDSKKGNIYISFKKIYIEKTKNTNNKHEYIYKLVKGISEFELEEEINKWAQKQWRCISVQPKIWSNSIFGEDIQSLSITPDYEYDILLEKTKN